MAATLGVGKVLFTNAVDVISSFLYRSLSVAATCDADANDIANLADVEADNYAESSGYYLNSMLYVESLESNVWRHTSLYYD